MPDPSVILSPFVERFRAVAAAQPDAVAIEHGSAQITYRRLDQEAAQFAERLRAAGCGPESVVGLEIGKSAEFLIALLGSWYAGAAFLPVDPSLPAERRRQLRSVSGASAWVRAAAPELILDDLRIPGMPAPPPSRGVEDLAYLIYTSGSTGEPKGVEVTHRGLLPVLGAQSALFRLRPGSRSLWVLSPSFDASVSDIGTALLSGATLVIPPASSLETAAGLGALLRELRITYADLPPSLLSRMWVEEAPECLETVVIGGEVCPPEVVRRWAERCRVINVYGPTEATICTSMVECDSAAWNRPLLGEPVPGTHYHVLDEERQPTTFGQPGELWIGGEGLARGYRNQPELTAERFVAVRGQRLYRTGDRVVRHEDGGLEFLGRMDRQVKVRGQLVSPEEVEARLLALPGVTRAAVLKRELGGGREGLAAFVVVEGEWSADSLRSRLRDSLPAWMVPQHVEVGSTLPLTPSGKVDLSALAFETLERAPAGEPPATAEESALAAIWERVLGRSGIGVTRSFWDLGGDSLALLEVLAQAEAQGVALSPGLLTAHPTIRAALKHRESLRDPWQDARKLREAAAGSPEWRQFLKAGTKRSATRPKGAERGALLTGATGFLGRHVLRELLGSGEGPLYCLVRAGSEAEGRRRLLGCLDSDELAGAADLQRVIPVPGDLSTPRLGLRPSQWQELAESVTDLYHCAAQVHSIQPYAEMVGANLEGTREVVRLAMEGRAKRLHYASTLSVFVATDHNQGLLLEDDDLSSIQSVYGGYAQSKFAAECLVREAATCSREDGPLPSVSNFRLGLLTGDVRTGRGVSTDFLTLFMRGLSVFRAVPESALELRVDITPVDWAAAAMLRLSLGNLSEGLSTYHLASPYGGASVADLVDALKAEGVMVEAVATEAWVRRFQEFTRRGRHPALATALLGLCRSLPGEESFGRHRTLDLFQATGTQFDMRRTLAGLAGSGLECPPPSPVLLRSYVRSALGGRS